MYIFHTFESVILTPRRRESYIHFRSVKFDSNWVKCTLAFLLCRPHRSACDSQINCQFTRSTSSYLKPQEEETKQNSIRYLSCALYSHTPEARTSIETYFWFLFHVSLHLRYIHMGFAVRSNTGNISVLNHEGEPMDITQATTCKLANSYAGERLTSVIQRVKVKKTDGVF